MGILVRSWLLVLYYLESLGGFLPQLALRVLLAYEFWVAGIEKFHGMNWFADVHSSFPFPFNYVPAEVSWHLSTWFELAGAIALLLGVATRFISVSLIVLTVVAWAAVHAGNGYNVCDNGYKLPLIYLVMFIPLLLNGAGKFSVDHWIWQRLKLVQIG